MGKKESGLLVWDSDNVCKGSKYKKDMHCKDMHCKDMSDKVLCQIENLMFVSKRCLFDKGGFENMADYRMNQSIRDKC